MKRFLIYLFIICFPLAATAATRPDNVYFRAMNDEMQRSLQQLHLKDHPNPYFVSYWIFHNHRWTILADMGALAPDVYNQPDDGDIVINAFLSVGSDKQDGLGFVENDQYPRWQYATQLPKKYDVPLGYESLRQALWTATDRAYLQAAKLYQQKKSYKKKKNIQDNLPDVMPTSPGHFVEGIPPFVSPDMPQLRKQIEQISALGKKYDFLESFEVYVRGGQQDWYFLNSRGAFAQYATKEIIVFLTAVFRQPNGKIAEVYKSVLLRDTSDEELARVKQKAQNFLSQVERARVAKSGSAYVGPVLLKPKAAARFLDQTLLSDLQNSKPFLLNFSDDDATAGKLYKKRDLRVSTDLLTVYDRPNQRSFDGFELDGFFPIDGEGVKAEDLTLVQDGYVKEFPLTQRPLAKNHRSNGHARIMDVYGPRERLTSVFVEPKYALTDQEMEDKLRARCRELGLEYGYILSESSPSGDLGIERIYVKDGRKETILNLDWDSSFTARDLRAVLAVGGTKELVPWANLVTPSILLQEAELVPVEHKPHRQPFIARPK